jgi:phosphoribosylamine--glycine ligase
VLYVGLMLTERGPMVLEFNCRFGDPETQAILLRLEDNFAKVARDAAAGRLEVQTLDFRREAVVCVVLAAAGYPGAARKGDVITGIDDALAVPGVTIYHAATKRNNGDLVTGGGRVLSVCARGGDLSDAIDLAYKGVDLVRFEGRQYRTDIGADTLAKLAGGRGEPD